MHFVWCLLVFFPCEGHGLSITNQVLICWPFFQALCNRKARLLLFACVSHGSVPLFKPEDILVEAEWECVLPRLCGYVGG